MSECLIFCYFRALSVATVMSLLTTRFNLHSQPTATPAAHPTPVFRHGEWSVPLLVASVGHKTIQVMS